MKRIQFTIHGEPASKANQRKIVKFGDRAASIKSDKARDYEHAALQQIPKVCRVRLDCPVRITLRIFYATQRPDLDESLILDVLQDRYKTDKKTKVKTRVYDGVYTNDRLVREKHVFHGIDKKNPRTEILIEPIDTVTAQPALFEVA